jgi:integrase
MSVEVKQDAKGVWYARPYMGTAPDGTKIRPYRQFPEASTRAQAQELANQWVAQLSAGGKVKSAVITDLLKAYIAERKLKGISPYTVKRWNLFTRSYVGKFLKGKSACKLSVIDLGNFETRLLMPNEKGGQGLSRNTVRSVHFFLRGAYSHWVKNGVCDMNPLFYVEPPTEQKHEAVALDEWDYPKLNEAIMAAMHPGELDEKTMREAAYAFAAWFALHTGMRVGEVCAMRRRDVSRRLGCVHVCGKIVELDGGGVERVDVTKGRKSRNVSMTERELETVFAFIRQQDSVSDAFTPISALVSYDGSFMRPTTVSKAFSRLRNRLGLPKGCTFHSLRHTHATWLLANGANLKDIADRFGHANESTTLRLYAHAMPGRDQRAAEVFDKFTDELKGGGANGVPTA